MLKFKKAEVDRLSALGAETRSLYEKLNAHLAEAKERADEIAEEINAKQQEAAGVLEDHVNEMDAYQSDRSEAWQEGERGSAYEDWKNTVSELKDGAEENLELELTESVEEPEWINTLIEGVPESPDAY